MSWKPLPLHRHLATVGIGPVFVCPPPHSLPVHDDVEGAGLKPNVGDDGATKFDDTTEPSPSQLQQHQHDQFPDQTILTWEIIGDIKSTPQDFIVREIGLAPPSKKCLQNLMEYNDSGSKQKHRWCRRVAGLDCKSTCIPHCLNDDSRLKKDDCSVENQNEPATVEVATGVLDGSNSDHDKQSEDNDKSIQNVPNLPTQMSCDDAETTETKRAKLEESPQNKVEMNTIKSTVESQQELPIAPTSLVSPQPQSSSPLLQNQNSNEKENSVQIKPMDKLRQILFQCTQQLSSAESSFASGIMQQDDADSILEKLGNLQHEANNDIRDVWRQGYSSSTSPHCADGDGHENKVSNDKKESAKHANIDVNAVWIPTAQLFKDASSTSSANNHDNWKLLHKCIREVFPFLRTEIPITCPLMKCNVEKANMEVDSKHPNVEHSNDKDKTCGSNAKNTTKPWVCAVIDRALFPLAPYLANPNVDLLALYKFRNRGPVAATAEELRGGRGDNRGGRDQQRRRNGGRNQRNQKPHATQHQQNNNEESVSSNQEKGIGSRDGLVFLRLQPELPRSERKNIHRILIGGGSGKSRRHEFETFTRSDVPLHDNDCSLNGNGVSVSVDVGESIVDPAKATTTTAIAVHWCEYS